MSPRFSIIIPHHDSPNLLMRCLGSIPICEDIQVIVVDDNSLDADSYLERYPQLSRPYLEFIRAPRNGGAGYVRNIGLRHATGKWLLFADADDFFADGMYDLILSKEASDADIVFFRNKGVLSEDIHYETQRDQYLNEIIDVFIQTGDEWPVRARHFVPWAKMIKRDLVIKYNILFDETKYSNDCFFSICSGYYARTIEAVNIILYNKTYRSGTLTADFCKKPDELLIRAEVAFRVDKFLLQHNSCRKRLFPGFLWTIMKTDKSLFKHYFNGRIRELYPSKIAAIIDLINGRFHHFSIY